MWCWHLFCQWNIAQFLLDFLFFFTWNVSFPVEMFRSRPYYAMKMSHSSIYFYWISRSRQIQFCSACNNDWKGRNVVDDVLIKQQMKFAFQRLLLLLYRISDVIWMPNKQAKDAVTRLNWIPAYADASGRKIPQIKSFRIFERILKNLYKYRLAYHTVYCSFAKTLLCHAFQNVQPNAIKGVHNSEQHQYLITTQLGA